MLKDKKLLIISNWFPSHNWLPSYTFVKEYTDEISSYFESVTVIIPISLWEYVINFKNRNKYRHYSYSNIKVFFNKYYYIPLIFSRFAGVLSYRSIYNFLKKEGIWFDFVHSHFTWPSGYVGMRLKSDFWVKSIITVHENRDWFLQEYNSGINIYRETWKNSDIVIRVNQIDVPLLKKCNKDSTCIYNWYNERIFNRNYDITKIKKVFNIPFWKKILLNVASYKIHHKNQINLIKSIKELLKIRKDFLLYLIWDWKDRKIIQNFIERTNLWNYVKIVWPKKHNEIAKWMNIADLFLLPSYSEWTPTVLFEAFWCWLPFIWTEVWWVWEIVIKEDYGFLLKNPEDYMLLSWTINKWLEKDWDKNIILTYSKEFTWKNIVGITKKYYN